MDTESDHAIDSTKYVVGLGNPGTKYAGTRHNVGFLVVDALVRSWSASGPRKAYYGLLWDARTSGGQRVMLLQPQTYMNRSGLAVADMLTFYKAAPSQVMVVLDDWNLPLGQVRIRRDGSAGGHKGLVDVTSALGTQDVPRLRIGIGAPPSRMDPVDFVLTSFDGNEQEVIDLAVPRAARAIEGWIAGDLGEVMNQYNRREENESQ